MSRTTALSLLAVCLLVGGLRGEETATGHLNGGVWSDTESGSAPTAADARQLALAKARLKLIAYLHKREPALRWLPSDDDLDHWSMIRTDVPRLVEGKYEVTARATVTEEDFQKILARDRQERLGERHLLAAKLLVALVLLLAVGAGYFRLEEMTRGYYTGTLRVLALAGIALVGVGLWLIF
jgi:hypothetical protein